MKNHGNQPKTIKTMKLPWKTMETREGVGRCRNKEKRDLRGVTTDLGGGRGRNKQKRHLGGVTTNLLDV